MHTTGSLAKLDVGAPAAVSSSEVSMLRAEMMDMRSDMKVLQSQVAAVLAALQGGHLLGAAVGDTRAAQGGTPASDARGRNLSA